MHGQISHGLGIHPPRQLQEGAAHKQLAESMTISVAGMMLIHPGSEQDSQNTLLFTIKRAVDQREL